LASASNKQTASLCLHPLRLAAIAQSAPVILRQLFCNVGRRQSHLPPAIGIAPGGCAPAARPAVNFSADHWPFRRLDQRRRGKVKESD
jgi:hypothetical protein